MKKADIKVVLWGCLIISLIFCVPMIKGSFRLGPDTTFHINRIIALADAIKNNDYFPKVLLSQNYNFGYGSPLFYSIFYLYPSALLILAGWSPYAVYCFTIFSICFLSAFTMYKWASLFYKDKNSVYILITVFVYIINLFFMSNIYKRGAIGEGFAYIFIPVVMMGITEIIYNKSYKWEYLVIGFSGLLLAHNITFVLMCILFLIILLVEYKRLLKNKMIVLNIASAAIFSLLITAFFTLMMIEQLSLKLYRVNYYFNAEAIKGIGFLELFYFFNGDNVYLNNTVGPILMFPCLLFFTKRNKYSSLISFLTVSGFVMILMTLKYFPWNLFKFMSFLQFPERLLTIACAFLSVVVGYVLSRVRFKDRRINLGIYLTVVLIGLIHIAGIYSEYGQFTTKTTADDLKDPKAFQVEETWYNVLEISSPDYIYYDSKIDFRNYGYVIKSNNEADKTVFDRSKYNELVFTVGEVIEGAYYILPVSYYKGYVIDVYEDESYLKTIIPYPDKETGLIRFDVDAYNGGKLLKFVCSYKNTKSQKLGVNISVVSTVVFVLYVLLLKSEIDKRIIAAVNQKDHTNSQYRK